MKSTPRIVRATLALLLLAAAPARAVEEQEIKIVDKWSVVGIIAGDEGGKQVGIAVLKNNQTQRTYTLSIGDTLPNEFGYTLQSVKGRRVVVTDGSEKLTLAFSEGPTSSDNEAESQA